MATRVRASKQTLALLAALAGQPSEWHYGYALSRETRLMSGTLYPILMRLEERGWLETQWEMPADLYGKKKRASASAYVPANAEWSRGRDSKRFCAAKGKTKPRGALRPARENARTHLGEPMLEQG